MLAELGDDGFEVFRHAGGGILSPTATSPPAVQPQCHRLGPCALGLPFFLSWRMNSDTWSRVGFFPSGPASRRIRWPCP